MNKIKGLTLIELIIVVAIIGILFSIIGPVIIGTQTFSELITGVNCKAGYKFSTDSNGNQLQIFDEYNRAIPCD